MARKPEGDRMRIGKHGNRGGLLLACLLLGASLASVSCGDDPEGKGGEGGAGAVGGTGGTGGISGTGGVGGEGGAKDCTPLCKAGESCLADPARDRCCTCPEATSCSETSGLCEAGTGGGGGGAPCSPSNFEGEACMGCLEGAVAACAPTMAMACSSQLLAFYSCASAHGCQMTPAPDIPCLLANCPAESAATLECLRECPHVAACFPDDSGS